MSENTHEGHRSRLKNRFLKEGLDNFEDHQILELLLFYSIPRRDTNDLAHDLMEKYGSLSGVLEADPKDISSLKGFGENSAILLSLIPEISRRYLKDKWKDKPQLNSIEKAGNYITNLFIGRTNEVFYVVCLDTQLKVIFPALAFEGSIKESAIYPRDVVQILLRHQASSVIFAHNHPGGSLKPSGADIEVTKKLKNILDGLSINVVDHIIVGGNNFYSFAQNSLI